MKIKIRNSAIILCLVILATALASDTSATRQIPAELRRFLLKQIRLSQKQLTVIQADECIVNALPTEKREEIAIFGIVHIEVSPEYFLERFRNITKFESGTGVLQSGTFSTPPVLSDISALKWEGDDLKNLKECKPNDCIVRLPGGSLSQLQKQIDWNSNKAIDQANNLIRRLSVEYVMSYQSRGDNALTEYINDGQRISVREGLHQLLLNSNYLHSYVPELVSYLRNFPNEKNPYAENFFYWQKADFGLQPVIRFNHVVIFQVKNSSHISYVIASKILYANHYFRDGLELRSLIPDAPNDHSKGFYFLVLNRSHVDGMTGLRGLLIRGPIVKKTVAKLKVLLTKVKKETERDYNKKP